MISRRRTDRLDIQHKLRRSEIYTKILSEKLKRKDHLECPGVDKRILLTNLEETESDFVNWIILVKSMNQ
jgi:hypothetical protein